MHRINQFINEFTFFFKCADAPTFEEKTFAIGGLKNLGLGGAHAKLIQIAADKTADRSVRVAAMGGLATIPHKDAKETLLPIYYDRNAHHELRTKAAVMMVMYHYEQMIVEQMIGHLYFEQCKYVKNFMWTLFEGLANTKSPCLSLE